MVPTRKDIMDTNTPRWRAGRRLAAGVGALALGVTGALVGAGAAQAAGTSVSGVELDWAVNAESGGGAFFGGCNFLSAGAAGNAGSSRLWTEADGFYKTQDGDVTIEKPNAAGDYAQPTWATKCQDKDGKAVTTAATSTSGNRVELKNGAGTVDTAAGTADITWDGSFTVVYYGGLTYWTVSDPELKVAADGTATLTGTASGWGADMNDTSKWTALTPTTITLANLKGVTVDADGFTVTPEYLGVSVDTGSGTAQSTSGATWGSFPQSFVDFQQLTGQSSYWYSSGGSTDARKVAAPLSVAWDVPAAPALDPKVTVSKTTLSASGETEVTVKGTGFDPSAAIASRPPLAGKPAGVYVAFGKFAEDWKPSGGAASSTRPTADVKWAVSAADIDTIGGPSKGAIELSADGSFTTTFTVSKDAADEAATAKGLTDGRYGIYTYPGGGAAQPGYETFTALTFVGDGDVPVDVTVPETGGENPGEPGDPGEFSWTVLGSGAVDLGTATAGTDVFTATGALRQVKVTDTRTDAPAWTLSGSVTDFRSSDGAASFGGKYLGWKPAVGANTVGAVAGTEVAPGVNDGLAASRTLASAAVGHPKGEVTVDAGLTLQIPLDTAAGDYAGTLTLTAVG
ncbi:hypothetical protein GCM10025864_20360 [Luteimicrobium album]|uniref:Htaa domain-containing protein n=1 Tax=Luteimicrobium album TaxID=1054550 RepID=A0ABQ6I1E6_9MICO|nr:hypothetical protein [Luteimicrobium album]GMA24277.1 hypothetical protein GCM10025864_20360 [Luteimicrobium album]